MVKFVASMAFRTGLRQRSSWQPRQKNVMKGSEGEGDSGSL